MKIHCLFDEMAKVKSLKPHPQNRNKHPDVQITRLAEILEYQGWRYPIKVSKLSGFITSGHGRLMAAQKLGLSEVPVNYQEYDNQEQEYADLTADNAIALWAEIDFAAINADLPDLGPDFNIDMLGLKDFILEPAEKLEPGCDEDEVPEKVEPKTKLGDLYELGSHRLLCGDSMNLQNVERLIAGNVIDMVFTDPPYGMNLETDYKGSLGDNGFRTAKSYRPVHGDDEDFRFLDAYALVESVHEQFWWGADYYCQNIPKNGSWFVWNKRTSDGLQKMYGNHFELCWSKQKHQREIASVAWAGAFGHNKKDDGPNKTHPTMKAVKLIEWFFERFKGEKVIDLFGGSGSTLIACEKTGRKCFMMELDPHYCDVIVARWEKFTGKQAILLQRETEYAV